MRRRLLLVLAPGPLFQQPSELPVTSQSEASRGMAVLAQPKVLYACLGLPHGDLPHGFKSTCKILLAYSGCTSHWRAFNFPPPLLYRPPKVLPSLLRQASLGSYQLSFGSWPSKGEPKGSSPRGSSHCLAFLLVNYDIFFHFLVRHGNLFAL